MEPALDDLRVLDLSSGPAGGVATMVLADFGADVLKVERPGGDPWRSLPAAPMWLRGKRSLTLDLDSQPGRDAIHQLVRDADVVVHSGQPRSAARLEVDADTLRALNPALVYCSITGFGPRGPFAHYKGYEGIVAAKAGRMMTFAGQLPREGPAFAAVQVGQHVAAQSAVHGILSALLVRHQTGRGQLVETSLLQGMMPYDLSALLVQQLMRRFPDRFPVDPAAQFGRMPTLQYHPVLTGDGQWLQLGNLVEHLYHSFIQAADLSDIYTDPRYQGPPNLYDETAREELRDRILLRMLEHTSDEWMQIFIANGNVASEPFRDTQRALEHPQLVHNADVIELDTRHGPMKQLGPIGKLTLTPGQPSAATPEAGEHSGATWHARPDTSRTPSATNSRLRRRPLEGVTIVEFATIIATPLACSILGDLGARVIKVETIAGDQMRGMLEGAAAAKTTASKEGLCLDLKDPRGQAIAHSLIANADAVIHNYRPGVPERLGIGYEQVREFNPEIVYVAATGYGSDGPYSHRPNAHPIPGAAIGGAFVQAGGAAAMPVSDDIDQLRETARRLMRANEVNPDPNTSMVIATAALLALYVKQTRGVGQQVQVNMMAANAYANSDDFVSYEGKAPRAQPDIDLFGLGPLYRLYPTADETWVFLACVTDDEWSALVATPDFATLGSDARFTTPEARRKHAAELATSLGTVFTARHADEWEPLLTSLDIACVRADAATAGQFFDTSEHVMANGFVAEAEHLRWGPYWRHGSLVQFSETPARAGSGILAGQHTRQLLREIGYEPEAVEALYADRVVASEPV
jgi:crotonobetainyl-CoA:carnitine CoA-transferase CaiB-like acyl-CoA transferase